MDNDTQWNTNQRFLSLCPFNNLHTTIEWEILRNLNYKEILNLSLTCRKWFKTISTAPNSAKPTIQWDEVITGEFEMHLIGKDHMCAMNNPNSCLFGKLECLALTINFNVRLDLLEFLIENKSKLYVNRLYLKLPVKCEKRASLIAYLADISPKIFFDNPDNHSTLENILDINKTVENITSHEMIENYNCLDASMTNIIIKQWIEGKRPNLQWMSCRISPTVDIVNVDIDMFISEFEHYVQEKKWRIDGNGVKKQQATIVVDGLPKLVVYCCRGYVFLQKMGCFDGYFNIDS